MVLNIVQNNRPGFIQIYKIFSPSFGHLVLQSIPVCVVWSLVIWSSLMWCLVYIFIEATRDQTRMRVWSVHLSRLPHSRSVLVSSRKSQRHVGKSVPSHMKLECLEWLASLSTILARECECLHSCILRLVHTSPKVSTSTWDENVNQAFNMLTRHISEMWM